jgi:hypothetical protein
MGARRICNVVGLPLFGGLSTSLGSQVTLFARWFRFAVLFLALGVVVLFGSDFDLQFVR